MTSVTTPSLLEHTKNLTQNPAELDNLLKQLSESADNNAVDRVITLYKKTILELEKNIWSRIPTKKAVTQYQNAFKFLEKLYALKTIDDRYKFKIVIPVADRPQHLQQCLDSLLILCRAYQYGGFKNNRYCRISVLIADDSKEKNNIDLHQKCCTQLNNNGIETEYFGLEDQLSLVRRTQQQHPDLTHIIPSTENINGIYNFAHKGASIMRNITYLKLRQDITGDDTLIYFIDSDQEFCINSAGSDNNFFAINYFHYLNENFSNNDITVLTGKVVGDPPVSPAVMASNFQQDIQNFLNSISNSTAEKACQYHQHQENIKDDAAYHDMAELFGFSNKDKKFNYHCTLTGRHSNRDCFYDFSSKLDHFFYGEHPTRKTYFNYEDGFSAITPARTVYTGNYVLKAESLEFFIPFATLKLRMAGPVLGRLLKTTLKHRFVSANLPMLHNRTVEATGQSEFRAGVKSTESHVDLSDEFLRQFFGDIMLFTMQKITDLGYPINHLDTTRLQAIVTTTYEEIKARYIEKHDAILQLKKLLATQLNNKQNWWNQPPPARTSTEDQEMTGIAILNMTNFLHNIQKNFSDDTRVYQLITSENKARPCLSDIQQAIEHYQRDMKNWKLAINS